MVRRIIIDSDCESEDEQLPRVSPYVDTPRSTDPHRNVETNDSPVTSRNPPVAPTRRLIRQRDVETSSEASFTVDSDIWTEESSIGSFIVHTDEFSEDDNGHDSGDFNVTSLMG